MTPFREAKLLQATPGQILVQLDDGWQARLQLLPDGHTGRLSLLPPGGWREPRTWALDPTGRFPLAGKPRDELSQPDTRIQPESAADGQTHTLSGQALRATVTLKPFGVAWQQKDAKGHWVDACADRDSYAYGRSDRTGNLSHWQARRGDERYYGLGDKTGPLNLHGRRLRTRMVDAMGYDAKTGDPLYKHWPFLLTHRPDTHTAFGQYWDTLAESVFDLGCEHDNYHGFYRSTEIVDGDLDLWVFAGPTLKDALARFVGAIGGTAMPPRWTLGYANTAMALTDHPQAQAQITALLDKAQAENFPLSSFHFGSGYTSIGKRRYVYHWNFEKFPDPQALTQRFAQAGIRTVANLKPCLLDDHPAYAQLANQGAFIRHQKADGSLGEPCMEQFWDGWGAHLDFTQKLDRQWWQNGLKTQILDYGIDVGWNDNNEYVIWAEDAVSHAGGEGARQAPKPLPFPRGRPLQPLLMTRATYDQQAASKPAERVYTITRAGCPGVQRYAQTWTGDNTTSWHTLRWNQRMALTLGLSGLFNVGHDIGGFGGPSPDAELLTRWVQACSLVPRMIMNSWKADGRVNTPWLHPEATPLIRAAIGLRLQLLPYLYTQLWRASLAHEPVLRATFFDFGDSDPATFADRDDVCDEMMVGPDLLVAPVFEPGARTRTLYLPRHGADGAGGWFCWHSGAFFAGGQSITVPAPLERLPLFVRSGAILPCTDGASDARRTDEPSRVLRWYPAPGVASSGQSIWIEDDGLSPAPAGGPAQVTVTGRADARQLALDLGGPTAALGVQAAVPVWLPPGEGRPLTLGAPAGLQLVPARP